MRARLIGAGLVYVIGASGSGKDTLIAYAREQLAADTSVRFARRYITRRAERKGEGESHVALTPEEFAASLDRKFFAMHWASHGLQYGVGIEIEGWLAEGRTVVVNGSRAYLKEAQQRYPALLPVTIDVSIQVMRERLLARARESTDAIERRIQRHLSLLDTAPVGVIIRNEDAIETAGDALVRLICEHTQRRGAIACG